MNASTLDRRSWHGSLARRRQFAALATASFVVAMTLAARSIAASLGRSSTFTGVTLATCLIVLTAIGMRRRLPGFKLGSMSAWSQIHLYTGIFAAAVYVVHVPSIVAGGVLEGGLSWLFLLVSGSGFYGLYASRSFPRRIRLAGTVEIQRSEIAVRAAAMFEDTDGKHDDLLKTHYQLHLSDYLCSPPGFVARWWPRPLRRHRRLEALTELDRYLDSETVDRRRQLSDLVVQCDAHDFVASLRRRMRSWVAVHASLTLALVVASAIHIAAVWSHRGT